MKIIYMLISTLMWLSGSSQGYSASVGNSTSAQGTVIIPTVQWLKIDVNHSGELSFNSADDLDNGISVANFMKATVISNSAWIMSIMSTSDFFDVHSNLYPGMPIPVSIMKIKKSNSLSKITLSNTPQMIWQSSNNLVMNEGYFDLEVDPGWNYPGGRYTATIVVTLTAN